MDRRFLLIAGILVLIAGLIASGALFTVHQTQQAIVLQFGEPKRVVTEPGLHVKVPLLQNVSYYEKRILDLDPPVERIILADQKPLLVDSYARYRITNALQFFQTVRNESAARQRIGTIVNAGIRQVLGNVNLANVLSEERVTIMQNIRQNVNNEARRFGVEIVDLRIRRSDLPEETSQAVYDRMKSEREREAAEFRAQGYEQSERIKASADREATVIRAEAEREADILRGQGEGERTRILNDAFGRDEAFFDLYRSLKAYEQSLVGQNTYMVLSPDSEFFSFFGELNRKEDR